MEKTLDEKLKSPTQSYETFEDWEKDFTGVYLKNNPRKTQDDLMFDPNYNTIRNKIYGKFVDLRNGIDPTIEVESESSKAYWRAREAYEQSMAGKTLEQVFNESYERTRKEIQAEKDAKVKEISDRIGALRAIFNACNPRLSDRFKKN
jgi:hypothetical protein